MKDTMMPQAKQRVSWALLPALLALAGGVQAQPLERFDAGYSAGPIRCESINNRTQQCLLQGRARLVRQLSNSACIEGQSWGQARSGVWVSNGCRAEFIAEGGRPARMAPVAPVGPVGPGRGRGDIGGWNNAAQVISCDSNEQRLRRCNVSIRRDARLLRQNSKAACIEGRTWGWDRSGIWVNGGCRGEFSVN